MNILINIYNFLRGLNKNTIIFIFSFITLFVLLGAFIKYPEKIMGRSFIVSENQINNIYSPNSGGIILVIKENTNVEKGDPVLARQVL